MARSYWEFLVPQLERAISELSDDGFAQRRPDERRRLIAFLRSTIEECREQEQRARAGGKRIISY